MLCSGEGCLGSIIAHSLSHVSGCTLLKGAALPACEYVFVCLCTLQQIKEDEQGGDNSRTRAGCFEAEERVSDQY